MADRAAALVDDVLPRVPVRQWVLTLPYRLRHSERSRPPRFVNAAQGALLLEERRDSPSRRRWRRSASPDARARCWP
jgi:hypothetical protein